MKVGDLIKFKGTWSQPVAQGERQTGIVMQIWTNGRTGIQSSVDVLWDNGDMGWKHDARLMEVVS